MIGDAKHFLCVVREIKACEVNGKGVSCTAACEDWASLYFLSNCDGDKVAEHLVAGAPDCEVCLGLGGYICDHGKKNVWCTRWLKCKWTVA